MLQQFGNPPLKNPALIFHFKLCIATLTLSENFFFLQTSIRLQRMVEYLINIRNISRSLIYSAKNLWNNKKKREVE
jgi:hypothetical protein